MDNAETQEFLRARRRPCHRLPAGRFHQQRAPYDLILDLAARRPALACKHTRMPGRRYLYVGGSVATLLQVLLIGPLIGRARARRSGSWPSGRARSTWRPLWCSASGKIATVIDCRYRLNKVPEALRYLGDRHAKGKVVIIVE